MRRVKKVACCVPVEERNRLAGDDLMQVEDQHSFCSHVTKRSGRHTSGAKQRLALHVVHVELQRGVSAQRGGKAQKPLAACMFVGPASNGIALRCKEPVQSGFDLWPLSLHHRPLKRADIVDIYINRQPVETEMKDIERRTALESEPFTQDGVARYFLQEIEEPEYLFEGPSLMTCIVGNPLKRLNRRRRHQSSSNRRSTTSSGKITIQPLAVLPSPGLVPRAYRA